MKVDRVEDPLYKDWMKVDGVKDPLYKDSYLGITPPTFTPAFEAPRGPMPLVVPSVPLALPAPRLPGAPEELSREAGFL